ncbi:PEP-CTERM sorting domain-containing protein [Polaromonas sp.]|uniref:PEP-CTERM sorting domain-containing protein n=1 Tax=Polaromonas sp. TaxID=1869339 RepID=UPI0037500A20
MNVRQVLMTQALCLLALAPAQARAQLADFAFTGRAIADLGEDTRSGGASGPSNVPDSLASFLVDGTTVQGSFSIDPAAASRKLPDGIAMGGTQYLLSSSKLQFGTLTHAGGPACDRFFADCSLVVFNNSDEPLVPGLQVDRLFLPSFRQVANSRPADVSYLLAQFVITDISAGLPVGTAPDLYPNTALASVLPTLDSTRADNNLRYSVLYFGQTVSGVQFRRTFEIQDVVFGPVGVVPEPSTWAMVLTGLALLCCALRRNRNTAVALAPDRSERGGWQRRVGVAADRMRRIHQPHRT